LTRLFLAPLVIHEEPNHGRKLFEHFSEYEDVKLAFVLLSPDDCVYPKDDKTTKSRLKPRQDVIFILGYLLGKLGKDKVLVLFRESANFEIPNDFEGITFVAFDDRGSWKHALIKHLANNGYTIDGQRILQ
jgi:predicted nucleotide-binding protein